MSICMDVCTRVVFFSFLFRNEDSVPGATGMARDGGRT